MANYRKYDEFDERDLPMPTNPYASYTAGTRDWLTTDDASRAFKNPEKNLASMYKMQLADFEKYQQPVIRALDEESRGTELIDRARLNAEKLAERTQGIQSRQMSLDANTLLPSQRRAAARTLTRGSTLASGSMVTSATAAQKEKRVAARQQMMSIAEQLQQTGAASTADVAAQKMKRDQLNKEASKSWNSALFSVAGAAIGGYFGGPQGAQMGAQAGGAMGGAVS